MGLCEHHSSTNLSGSSRRFAHALYPLVLALACPAAFALDADEILNKAEARLYNAKNEGLRELSFEVQSPVLDAVMPRGRFPQNSWLTYHWKAGEGNEKDKGKLKVEVGAGPEASARTWWKLNQVLPRGIDSDLALFLGGRGVDSNLRVFWGGVVRAAQTEEWKRWTTATRTEEWERWTTRSAEEVGGKYRVTVSRKKDAPHGKIGFTKRVLTFSKGHKLETMLVEPQGFLGAISTALPSAWMRRRGNSSMLGGESSMRTMRARTCLPSKTRESLPGRKWASSGCPSGSQ